MIEFKKPTHQHEDYQRFYMATPDPDFSPDKNKHIVQKTIKHYEENRKKRRKAYRERVMERADAASDYLTRLASGYSGSVESYFGKRYLAYLQGRKIMHILKPDKSIELVEMY